MPSKIDLIGQRFGRLFVLDVARNMKIRSWICECDCRSRTIVTTNKLTSGHTSSCGCLRAETTLTNGKKNKKHGASRLHNNRTYRSWGSMRYRCKPESRKGKNYADRGISICERWDSFENFLADMGERPEGMTLDRIDVNGNYDPSNCRWATPKTQQRNKRRARRLLIDGVPKSSMDIADEICVSKNAMQYFFSVAKKLKEKYGYVPNPEDS